MLSPPLPVPLIFPRAFSSRTVMITTPTMKYSDQDFYMVSENETAQIIYDAAQKVIAISVDYLGGIGAPG